MYSKNSIGGREVCHGVPAVDSWFTYLEERENEVIRDQGGTSLSVDLVYALRDVVDRPMQQCDYDLVAPIQVSEVWETMKGMRGGSAPYIDGIPTALWKWGRVWLLPVITGMFSGILNSAEWPLSWATSVLVPLFKKGDRLDHENYGGISLSNVLSKVFAKILCCRIDNCIDQNRILSDSPAGFRKCYSPIDQIFILLGMIRKQVRRKEGRLFVVFLDLKGAFDGVD